MRIGALFPTLEVTDPAAVRDYAQAAEDLGYVLPLLGGRVG